MIVCGRLVGQKAPQPGFQVCELTHSGIHFGMHDDTLLGRRLVARSNGVYVWDIFFGLNVLVLGWLSFRSGFLPKLLGIVLMIGSAGYLLEGLRHVTFVESPVLAVTVPALIAVAALGELAFAFWLIVKNPNGTFVAKAGGEGATGQRIAAAA